MQIWLSMMVVWKRDMVGCGRAGQMSGGTIEGVEKSKACHIHEHLSTTAPGNGIGGPGAKGLSMALAKCPNLHTLDLSGQWVASCLSAVRWEAGFG